MKNVTVVPRPILMRDVHTEPLDASQQLMNIANGTDLTDMQKKQLCHAAYKMEFQNSKAAAVRAAGSESLTDK